MNILFQPKTFIYNVFIIVSYRVGIFNVVIQPGNPYYLSFINNVFKTLYKISIIIIILIGKKQIAYSSLTGGNEDLLIGEWVMSVQLACRIGQYVFQRE